MAGAYSRDLRSRVLAAVKAGETLEAAARRFAVGRSTVYRRVAAMRDEGRRKAKPMEYGPAPVIGDAAETAMLELAGSPHHLGLAEIAARLAETHGARVHLTTVHRALRRAGHEKRQVPARHPCGPRCPGAGRGAWPFLAGSASCPWKAAGWSCPAFSAASRASPPALPPVLSAPEPAPTTPGSTHPSRYASAG